MSREYLSFLGSFPPPGKAGPVAYFFLLLCFVVEGTWVNQ
jgi:hypothetical protein